MGRTHDYKETDGRVVVGPPPPPDVAPDDVLPATRQRRSDGVQRYICYDDSKPAAEVAASRLSVDGNIVVSRELWR